MLTQAQLKQQLSYDPTTGDFTWIISDKMAGKKAGTHRKSGYWIIQVNGKKYFAQRLVWLYVYGAFPSGDTDHINGNPSDNKIGNLRECSRKQNLWNIGICRANTSGFKGVAWRKSNKKWAANIMIDGKTKHIGYFATAELASETYIAKAKALHGEFYRDTN